MTLPVWCIDRSIFDWVTAVYHYTVSAIDTHMADRSRRIVSTCKKDNVSCLGICRRHRSTLVINALCRGSWQIMYAAVGKYPAYKAGTVKARGRKRTAPYIRITKISCCFLHKCLVTYGPGPGPSPLTAQQRVRLMVLSGLVGEEFHRLCLGKSHEQGFYVLLDGSKKKVLHFRSSRPRLRVTWSRMMAKPTPPTTGLTI